MSQLPESDRVRVDRQFWGEYDQLGRGSSRGLWGMLCFNAMSADHQVQLVVTGKFRGYDGGTCDRPAQVGIETEMDVNPGPRFYCRPCGIEFLQSQPQEKTNDEIPVPLQRGQQ